MAISLEQLEGYLLQEDLRYVVEGDRIWLRIVTDDYVDYQSGKKSMTLGIGVTDDGTRAEIRAPGLYIVRRSKHVGAMCELCLSLSGAYHALRFEFDRTDGEVAASRHFLAADGTLTRRALLDTLRWLPGIIDFWHPVFDRAMTTGELPTLDHLGSMPEVARMVAEAGGIDRFVAMVREQMAKEAGGEPTPAPVETTAPARPGRTWTSWAAGIFFA
jgi:hypothetical protein